MSLPEPHFIDRDPDAITAEIIARYEQRSGKTLYPAQVERLFVDLIAYRETLVRAGVQAAAKQNLVAFAQKPVLDYLGELVGVTRLPAQPARTTLRFAVESAQARAMPIPAETRVECDDGAAIFATEADATLPAGETSIDVIAYCETPGAIGNGFAPERISQLLEPLDTPVSVINVTPSAGGAEEEEDEPLRERIRLAPEGYSVAGPGEAYEVRVRAVHQDIIDVAVLGPEDGLPDGHVEAYPLTAGGVPSDELLALVEAQVSHRKRRPLTDKFRARAPHAVRYRISAGLMLLRGFDEASVLANALAAAQRYARERRARLGRDLVRGQLNAALHVPGVYDVVLDEAFADRVLARHEWAACDGIELKVLGIHDE